MTIRDIQCEGVIPSIAFRRDGRHILGGSGLGTVRKWGTADGREVGRVMSVGVEVGAVATSKDGLWIVGGTTTGSAIVWKGTTHEKVVEVKAAHADWVLSVDISSDCKTFATGSYDETAVVWDLATAGTRRRFGPLKHPSHVGAVRFSPSGDRLATATQWGDLSIRIFDSHSGELVSRIPNSICTVYPNTLAWADNGQRIFAAYEVSINQFNVATTALVSSWKVDPHIHVQNIAVADSGQFVVCSIDRTVAIWDTLTHTTITSPIQLTGRLKSVAISPDDTRLAIGQDDDKISLHSLPDILPHSYFVTRNIPVLVPENSQWNMSRQSRSAVIPFMHVSDVAFKPWVQGKLGNAESVFTQEIIRPSNRDHHALANRALIRARSKRWKEAIDDAEKSLKMQSSVMAHIAKSIALVGDGKVNDGYRVCDLEIAHSTSNDAHFLRVIKSVIFCMAEDNEDAISRVNDLTGKVDDKSLFYFVQAQLYFWFGDLQLSRGEYERAVQSFKHAQPPTQLLDSPYLTTISLVFGWNFEDLYINVQRGLCEALCKADQPKEAIETLHKMMGCFGEEARPTQSITDWITDFTKRCVLTLERTGDAAFASNDHEKATIHYALALLHYQAFPKTTLKKWINAKLTNRSSWKEVLRDPVEFKVPRIAIYQGICEVLVDRDRLTEATECFHTMSNEVERETTAIEEYDRWVLDFKHRCGDVAMQLQQYDAAIEHYSAAVSHQPQKPDALVKRSKARAAKGLWDDALQDTEEAMKLDPSSPLGYEMKHAVLCGASRYDQAMDVFKTMLTMIEQSDDSAISQLRNNYVSPSETIAALDLIVHEILKYSPLVLIDVTDGQLRDWSERTRIFKDDPTFKELVCSMTKKVDKEKIRHVVERFLAYVMFSHVWSRPEEGEEPLFQGVMAVESVWNLPKSPQNEKLRNFCRKTRNLDYRWAWSDTCCIDKLTNVILDQSLTSMYKWYEHSAATLVLLTNMEHPSKLGDLPLSTWMTRAWTLQELLAPKVILFYDSVWKPYLGDTSANHKKSEVIMKELADAIKVSSGTIVAFHPEDLSVREKLRLASTRNATKEEDIAYSLIGIFKSDVKPHYGEGPNAIGHLLSEIVTRSGEVTVLDWIGKSSLYNSCLPASLSVYSQAPHSAPALEREEIEASTVQLLAHDEIMRFYAMVSALPDASFLHRRLSLPCIAFRASSLCVLRFRDSEVVYIAEVPGLRAVEFTGTTSNLFELDHPEKLVFVYPWIHRVQDLHGVARGHGAGINVASAHTPSYAVPVPQVDEHTRALQLVARLGRWFNALLLLQQSDNKYRRVAAEHEIIVEPQITSLTDIRVETLQIL